MKKFRYRVSMEVEVQAYDQTDAFEAVQDVFGIGEEMGVNVVDCEYEDLG